MFDALQVRTASVSASRTANLACRVGLSKTCGEGPVTCTVAGPLGSEYHCASACLALVTHELASRPAFAAAEPGPPMYGDGCGMLVPAISETMPAGRVVTCFALLSVSGPPAGAATVSMPASRPSAPTSTSRIFAGLNRLRPLVEGD